MTANIAIIKEQLREEEEKFETNRAALIDQVRTSNLEFAQEYADYLEVADFLQEKPKTYLQFVFSI